MNYVRRRAKLILMKLVLIVQLVILGLLPLSVSQAQTGDALNGYAIRITYRDNNSRFTPMTGDQVNFGFTVSPSMVNKPPVKDSERVAMINVNAMLSKDKWLVKVSVLLGEFHDQGTKLIVTSRLSEGEELKISELTQYGLEPFDLSVVKIDPVSSLQPEIVNRTSAIEILSVKSSAVPAPYHIRLKNISGKVVQALEINTYQGSAWQSLKWPEGSWDHPLIVPGATYEIDMPSAAEYKSIGADDFRPSQSGRIEITTAVFTDGTYEGKEYLAAILKANAIGSRNQLDRVLALLDRFLESSNPDTAQAIDQLKEAASSLDILVQPEYVLEIRDAFPTLDQATIANLSSSIRSNMHTVKGYLLSDVAAFQKKPKQGSSFHAWLQKEKEHYLDWRSKLY